MTLTHTIFPTHSEARYQIGQTTLAKHLCKPPQQKPQHLAGRALNYFSHCEDFSFIPQQSCQLSKLWGPLISYICPRRHVSKKKPHVKGGFPTCLPQRKNVATMRRREPFCWQISMATDVAPTVAIIDSSDLFGSPSLTLCTKQRVKVVTNCWTICPDIYSDMSPMPHLLSTSRDRAQPVTVGRTWRQRKARGVALPNRAQQRCAGGAVEKAKHSEIPAPFYSVPQMENSISQATHLR